MGPLGSVSPSLTIQGPLTHCPCPWPSPMTTQGPHSTGTGWKAGSWPSTERPSCCLYVSTQKLADNRLDVPLYSEAGEALRRNSENAGHEKSDHE